MVSIFRTPRKESFDEVVGVLPNIIEKNPFFPPILRFRRKEETEEELSRETPFFKPRSTPTDRQTERDVNDDDAPEGERSFGDRDEEKKKQTKPPKRDDDDDFEKNDREKKQHTKTLVGVWYTCTTKTVKVPNKKLATKRKRRVKVVLLEIVVVIFVVVILFFLCACDEVMSTT